MANKSGRFVATSLPPGRNSILTPRKSTEGFGFMEATSKADRDCAQSGSEAAMAAVRKKGFECNIVLIGHHTRGAGSLSPPEPEKPGWSVIRTQSPARHSFPFARDPTGEVHQA